MAFDKVLQALLTESACIDIHCHATTAGDNLEIVSIDTLDFERGASIGIFYALGIHPWFIGRQDSQAALHIIATVSNDSNLLAVGECGLDKCIDTPLDLQIEIFTRQIELAEHIGKPLIIHCVKAFNEILQIKKTRKVASTWIIHGFTADPVLARQLIKHGCYLSFGAGLLNPRSRAGQALVQTPLDRLFLETDTSDESISAIYAAAAKMLRIDVATLQQQILSNFKRVFLQ